MNKIFISALIGAIIIFMFQAMSWMMLPTHKNSFKQTPAEKEILTVLNSSLADEGVYRVPGVPQGASKEQMEQWVKEIESKPYAVIQYHKAWTMSMAGPMVIGFILNLVSMLIIAWILFIGADSFQTFGTRFIVAASFFVVALFQSRLMDANWWHTPGHYLSGEVVDMIIMAVLSGLWMGWYWGRGK